MGKRIFRVTLLYLGAAAAALGYLLLVRKLGFGIPCILHETTGFLCPGCGLTRAMVAVSKGELAAAISYNAFLIPYVLYVGWFLTGVTVRYIKGKKDPLFFGPSSLHIVMLCATVLYGIARNLV